MKLLPHKSTDAVQLRQKEMEVERLHLLRAFGCSQLSVWGSTDASLLTIFLVKDLSVPCS